MGTSTPRSNRSATSYSNVPTPALRRIYAAEVSTVNVTPRQTRQSRERLDAMLAEFAARGEYVGVDVRAEARR